MTQRATLPLAALALMALFFGHAGAAIMAVDLGSEYLKISLLKPGKIPISIVNNEMSKRKSPAAVAFVNGDRLLGDEAAALSVRYPDRVFTRLRDFLGRQYDDPAVERLIRENHLAFSITQAPNRSTIAVKVGEGENAEIYTAEELVASLLEYAKRLAADAADGSPVTDCVLVVPAFWGPAQRQALLDAAELAGLNVMSLVHTHAAAALQYGIERDFTNKTEDVLFYDLGGGAVEAALVRFSSFRPAGAAADAPATSQFEVKDVAWVEHSVGCDALESALVEHFAKAHKSGAEAVLSSPRAVAKLRKQVKRTKEVLSANTEAPVIVEELLSGEDFRGKITREDFEGLVENVWSRAAAPLVEIIRRNNLTAENLSAVELLGGCSRVPRVKAALSDALGGRALDMHLDADEAVVLGAGLVAANLSTIFRLRKFGMTDKAPYTVTFNLEGAEEEGAQQTKQDDDAPRVLVPALRKIPTKRAIALHNITSDSFSVTLQYDNSAGAVLPCCARKESLGEFQVSGITTVVSKYGYSGKVALHTAVDGSGVFKVDRADAAVEIEEEIKPTPPPAPPAGANDTTADGDSASNSTTATANDTAVPERENADQRQQQQQEESAEATGTPSVEDELRKEAEAAGLKEKKTHRRTIRIPLNITGVFVLPGLTVEQRAASRKVLRTLRDKDEAKRATAKARDDLEAYIINTREKLDSNEALKEVSTEEQREAVVSALMDAEDWLYGDGDSAAAAELREKLRKLRKAGDAIESRAGEAANRPEAVKAALDFVELARKAANAWPTIKPWLNETEVAAAVENIEEFHQWVEKSVAEQETKAKHEDPVFKVTDIAKKMDPVRKAFSRLNTKPKPIEKKKEKAPDAEKAAEGGEEAGAEKTIPEGEQAKAGDGHDEL